MAKERITSTADERELITRCLRGEEAACTELFHLHYRPLMAICMRYAKNTQTAEDILQDGYMRIFSGLASFRGQGSFQGWLKRVMVTTAINHYKAGRREFLGTGLDEMDRHEMIPDTSNDEGLSRLAMGELLQLVQGLPPAYRMVFNLRVMDGWSHDEIAKELGISTGTSKSNLNRARAILINALAARERPRSSEPTGHGN